MTTNLIRIILGFMVAVELLAGLAGFLGPFFYENLNPEAEHNLQEVGAGLIFIGLVSFWCIKNLESARPLLYFKLIFFFLFALLHWYEYLNDNRTLMSPLINSVPFFIMILVILLNNSRTNDLQK